MATPLGTLGLSFVFCLIIAIFCVYLFIFPAFTTLACILVYVVMHHFGSTHFTNKDKWGSNGTPMALA
jgi:hypothetical protein